MGYLLFGSVETISDYSSAAVLIIIIQQLTIDFIFKVWLKYDDTKLKSALLSLSKDLQNIIFRSNADTIIFLALLVPS